MDPRLQPYLFHTETQFLVRQFRFRAPPGNIHEEHSDEVQQRFSSTLLRIPHIPAGEPLAPFRSPIRAACQEITDGRVQWDVGFSERSPVALIDTCSPAVLSTLRRGLQPAYVRERCFDSEASKSKTAKWIVGGIDTVARSVENCIPASVISSKESEGGDFKEISRNTGREDVGSDARKVSYAELGNSIARRRMEEAGVVRRGAFNDYILGGGVHGISDARRRDVTAFSKRKKLTMFTEILAPPDEIVEEDGFTFEDKFQKWKAEFRVDQGDNDNGTQGEERAGIDGGSGEELVALGCQVSGLPAVTSVDVGQNPRDRCTMPNFLINLVDGKLRPSARLLDKEVPILCESLDTPDTVLDVVLSAALQDLESILDRETPPEWPTQSDPKASPFLQIFAADAVPDCEFQRLPVVVLMEDGPCKNTEVESKLETWREGVELCAVTPQSVCHLELYLDWGLSDPVASVTKEGIDDMLREWKPQRSPITQPKRKDAIAMMIRLDCKADPFQAAPCSKVQPTPPAAEGPAKNLTEEEPAKQTLGRTIQEENRAGGNLKNIKKMDFQDDFDFFLELHLSKCPQENDGNGSVMQTMPKSIEPAANQRLETLQEIKPEPEIRVENVALPPSMTSLLVQLEKEHNGVVLSCHGLPEGVTSSSLMDVEAMTATLKGLAGIKGSRESPPLEVFQTCSLIAVLRQTAVLLLHFGPRVGFLYLKQGMNDLVALRGRLCDISKSLAEAYCDVESGKTLDHPKLEALKNALMMSTQGKRILILCDPCAFFTLYPIISRCGLKPYQLDRDGSIHTLSQDGVKNLVSKAFEGDRKCILASHRHLSLPGFPLESIDYVIEYSQTLRTTDTAANWEKLVKKWTTLQSTNPISLMPVPQKRGEKKDNVAAAKEAIATDFELDFPQESQQGNLVEVPVVINSRDGSAVSLRRDLFEAILHLETKGIAIISRDLGFVDVAFPPSVAICIWPVDGKTSSEGSVASAVQGILDRMSGIVHAYSSIMICIEGRGPLVSALTIQLGSLQAECSLKAVHINTFSTTSPKQTQDFATNIISSLQKTTPAEMLSKFPMTDMQSPRECFFQRLPFLNPFSVYHLSRLRPTLREIINVIVEDWEKVSGELPEVSSSALEVCSILFSEGKPIVGDVNTFEDQQQIEKEAFEDEQPLDGSYAPGDDGCHEDLNGCQRERMYNADFQSNECIHDDDQWMHMQNIDMQHLMPPSIPPPEFAVPRSPNPSKSNEIAMVNGDENGLDEGTSYLHMQSRMGNCDGVAPMWRQNCPIVDGDGGEVDDFEVFDALFEEGFGGPDVENVKSGSNTAVEAYEMELDGMNWEVDREFDACLENGFLKNLHHIKSRFDGGSAAMIDEWEGEHSRKLPCSSSHEKGSHQDRDLDATSPHFHPDSGLVQNQPGVDEFGVGVESFMVQSQGMGFERSMDNDMRGLSEVHTGERDFLRGMKGSIDLRTAQWNDFAKEEKFSQIDDLAVGSGVVMGMDDLGQQNSNVARLEKGHRQWGSGGHWVHSNFLKFKRR